MQKTKHKIPDYKIKEIDSLTKLIEGKNTIMLVSIRGLPARQFQKIKKSLSDRVEIKVVKKRALSRSIDNSKKTGIDKLKEHLSEDIAILASDLDSFELSAILGKEKSPVGAKAGQESNVDIEVPAGLTEIPAGPAVSELGSLGLQVKVTNGKLEIMEDRVVVKVGDTVSETAASVLTKLNITPFSVGFIPLVSYDSESGKVFTELTIDSESLANNMKEMFAKARAFAVSLAYVSKDTIGFLLGKANSHEKALSNLVKDEVKEETKEEKVEETKTEESEEPGKEEKPSEEKVEETEAKEESKEEEKNE